MNLPQPLGGQVIRYVYLWANEAARGLEEGQKDRPAVVVIVLEPKDDQVEIVVAPITHRPQKDSVVVPVPAPTRARIGLDDRDQWIVLSDLNRFAWPGPDIRPLLGQGLESVFIGALPPKFMGQVRDKLAALLKSDAVEVTRRTT